MTTTLVTAKHDPTPHVNGFDGCHARGSSGCCPGGECAAWLNSLGDDDAKFGSTNFTAGEVRSNYLRTNQHVVAADPELARLVAERVRLRKELRAVERKLAQIEEGGI